MTKFDDLWTAYCDETAAVRNKTTGRGARIRHTNKAMGRAQPRGNAMIRMKRLCVFNKLLREVSLNIEKHGK